MFKIESFKELLLSKTKDETLKDLIKSSSDFYLIDGIIDSLEKMAAHQKGTAKSQASTNQMVKQFSEMSDPIDHELLRDAIAHHGARAIAARDAGNDSISNHHAHQWVALNNLARKVENIAPGSLGWEPPADIKPWQANIADKWKDKNKSTGFDIPGWQYHDNKNNHKMKGSKEHDYSHLFQSPDIEHGGGKYLQEISDTKHKGENGEDAIHSGRYPFEHTKVAGKYVSMKDQDVSDTGTYKPHPFDSHPIVNSFTMSPKNVTPEHIDAYHNGLQSFEESKMEPNIMSIYDKGTQEGHGATPHFNFTTKKPEVK